MSRIVLIHGFGCDSRFWAPQVSALVGHDVCAPDLPYHGGPDRGVPKTLEGLADWVVQTHLASPAILMGHSLGGMMALQIVHDHPELVEGIVLMDAFPALPLNAQHLAELYYEPMDADLKAHIEDIRERIITAMPRTTYEEIWPSIAAFDARPWLGEITCPLLGVYGGRGRYGEGDAERLKHDLLLHGTGGSVTLAVVEQAGHFVNLEWPEVVNAVLLRWLAEVEPGGNQPARR